MMDSGDSARELVDAGFSLRNSRRITIRRRWVLLGLGALALLGVLWFMLRFMSDRAREYSGIEDHFKYGSIGSEPGGSLFEAIGGMLPPEAVFSVLPAICPEELPDGYESLGLLGNAAQPLPIGISQRKRLGFDQIGINCALCHTGSYRESPESARQVVLGMPANRLELQRLFRFIIDCVLDERFTADNVIGRLEQRGTPLNAIDRVLYRLQVIPRLREATLQQREQVGLLLDEGAAQWGPGRVDTFNPYKATQFHWRLAKLPPDELIGAANYPSLWNQKPRDGLQLHWDGNNSSVEERNLSAALGAGVTPVTADHRSIKRVRDWIWMLPPPNYPFAIDPELAAKGAHLYASHCRSCHGDETFRSGVRSGELLGKVTPIEHIGTDPYRLNSYTHLFSIAQATLYPDSRHRFSHFRKTDGYSNRPLDGIWARAPYLHNGSVPTLRDLLDAPSERPTQFYRGDDVFDQVKVGFRTDRASEGRKAFFRYDTMLPGNGNGGHSYGLELSDSDKDALVEHMKTF
jgi:mono/diheme cytochrome c family protein